MVTQVLAVSLKSIVGGTYTVVLIVGLAWGFLIRPWYYRSGPGLYAAENRLDEIARGARLTRRELKRAKEHLAAEERTREWEDARPRGSWKWWRLVAKVLAQVVWGLSWRLIALALILAPWFWAATD